MFIDGFMISGYRSFGKTPQRIGPLGKINLMVGQNNSGKSNILRFLEKHFRYALTSAGGLKDQKSGFGNLDTHRGESVSPIVFGFGLVPGSPTGQQIRQDVVAKLQQKGYSLSLFDKLLESIVSLHDDGVAWFKYTAPILGEPLKIDPELFENLSKALEYGEWHSLWQAITNLNGGELEHDWIPQVVSFISPVVNVTVPDIKIVPAIRRATGGTPQATDLSGQGIIEKLAQLQNPDIDKPELRQNQRFERINVFLKTVMGNDTCRIEIPYKRQMILVHMDGRTLPLESFGTGIHEVIILAAAATVSEKQILCIEEPELHLHPSLQKKFLSYLSQETDNQYFITTHSAHFLDVPDVTVFHVRTENGTSSVNWAYTSSSKSNICSDLGYHASDLFQSNCIIWVEGPSDRIYVRHFICTFDQELVEGLHYSIMFYGGRLMSHLTASDDSSVDDFISLRRLNRNICIMMDSDKSSAGKRINKTKMRIRDEFEEEPGFVWVTKGREIENYIDPITLESAIKAMHGKRMSRYEKPEPYDKGTLYLDKKGEEKKVDKVDLACEVVRMNPGLDRLDLKKQVKKLVEFVRQANDLEPPSPRCKNGSVRR